MNSKLLITLIFTVSACSALTAADKYKMTTIRFRGLKTEYCKAVRNNDAQEQARILDIMRNAKPVTGDTKAATEAFAWAMNPECPGGHAQAAPAPMGMPSMPAPMGMPAMPPAQPSMGEMPMQPMQPAAPMGMQTMPATQPAPERIPTPIPTAPARAAEQPPAVPRGVRLPAVPAQPVLRPTPAAERERKQRREREQAPRPRLRPTQPAPSAEEKKRAAAAEQAPRVPLRRVEIPVMPAAPTPVRPTPPPAAPAPARPQPTPAPTPARPTPARPTPAPTAPRVAPRPAPAPVPAPAPAPRVEIERKAAAALPAGQVIQRGEIIQPAPIEQARVMPPPAAQAEMARQMPGVPVAGIARRVRPPQPRRPAPLAPGVIPAPARPAPFARGVLPQPEAQPAIIRMPASVVEPGQAGVVRQPAAAGQAVRLEPAAVAPSQQASLITQETVQEQFYEAVERHDLTAMRSALKKMEQLKAPINILEDLQAAMDFAESGEWHEILPPARTDEEQRIHHLIGNLTYMIANSYELEAYGQEHGREEAIRSAEHDLEIAQKIEPEAQRLAKQMRTNKAAQKFARIAQEAVRVIGQNLEAYKKRMPAPTRPAPRAPVRRYQPELGMREQLPPAYSGLSVATLPEEEYEAGGAATPSPQGSPTSQPPRFGTLPRPPVPLSPITAPGTPIEHVRIAQEEKKAAAQVVPASPTSTVTVPRTPVTPTKASTAQAAQLLAQAAAAQAAAAEMPEEEALTPLARAQKAYDELGKISEAAREIYEWAKKQNPPITKLIFEKWVDESSKAENLNLEIQEINRSTPQEPKAIKDEISAYALYAPDLVTDINRNTAKFERFLKLKRWVAQLKTAAQQMGPIPPRADAITAAMDQLSADKKRAAVVKKVMEEILAVSHVGRAEEPLIKKRARDVLLALDTALATIETKINTAKAALAESLVQELEKSANSARAVTNWNQQAKEYWRRRLDDAMEVGDDIDMLVAGTGGEKELLARTAAALEKINNAIPEEPKRAKTIPSKRRALGSQPAAQPAARPAGQEEEKKAAAAQLSDADIAQLSNADLVKLYIPLLLSGNLQNPQLKRLAVALAQRFPGATFDEQGLIQLATTLKNKIETLSRDARDLPAWRRANSKTPQETIDFWEKQLIPAAQHDASAIEAIEKSFRDNNALDSANALIMIATSARALTNGIRQALDNYKIQARGVQGETEHKQLASQLDSAIVQGNLNGVLNVIRDIKKKMPPFMAEPADPHLREIFHALAARADEYREFFSLREMANTAVASNDHDALAKLFAKAQDQFTHYKHVPKMMQQGFIQEFANKLIKMARKAEKAQQGVAVLKAPPQESRYKRPPAAEVSEGEESEEEEQEEPPFE